MLVSFSREYILAHNYTKYLFLFRMVGMRWVKRKEDPDLNLSN